MCATEPTSPIRRVTRQLAPSPARRRSTTVGYQVGPATVRTRPPPIWDGVGGDAYEAYRPVTPRPVQQERKFSVRPARRLGKRTRGA